MTEFADPRLLGRKVRRIAYTREDIAAKCRELGQEITETYPEDFPGVDPSLVVIEKVRHGRFFNIGGEMPLFSEEALSDDDLGALLSYLEL